MTQSLDQRVAIVTGSAQGIGAAISLNLARSGAKVVLVDLLKSSLDAQEAELRSLGYEILPIPADVSDKKQINQVVEKTLAKFGRIDVLVNNAGITRDGWASDLTEEAWDLVLSVNLKGVFLFCQAVYPQMKAQGGGRIINISSRSWLGNKGQANYSASKGGVVSLTRTLALEWANAGIHVNAVAPGLIDTPMTQKIPESAKKKLLQMQPTGGMGTPEDVADAVEFLARAKYIVGQILHVDGGKSCGLLSLG